MNSQPTRSSTRRKLLWGTGIAIVAGAVTVLFILPSELGIDPTGFGESSGLSKMANPGAERLLARGRARKGVFTPGEAAQEPGIQDHWEYELHPYEEIELKYEIEQGKPMAFRWSATGPLNYDMHAHPFAGGEAETESYDIAKADRQSGRYVAAFTGIHGWHWQNRGMTVVRITLDASGTIKSSRVIKGGIEQERGFTPPAH
ncbi:hypothetical protein GGQ88_000616 [Novosphingobium hassiacum]|uniref:Uncharacterized protein n=1 Tax=Novosphingobium hassiacum TaxID=173676 RepID=A0A7W5ZTV5_9SPHN|nr:hypothetical protein [Novosphingobium hassiacum]MBB3859376.1 hypothetical protein [Novosphingobium hassiacum]